MLDAIVIVGAGRTTASMLQRLVSFAPVTVIDTAQAALGALQTTDASIDWTRLRFHMADGTSRLVLEDLRKLGTDVGFVAATGLDRQNLEACRLATELGFKPVVGIVIDATAAPEYEKLGVRAVVRATLLGDVVERALRYDGLGMATSIGQGRREIVEFVVLPGSPAVGASLIELHADRWRIAAIYRNNLLVIPTGGTRIEAEDRILLVGEADLIAVVAEQLRVGQPMFPLSFGKNVVAYMPSGFDGPLDAHARTISLATRAEALVRTWPQAQAATATIGDGRTKQQRDVPLPGAIQAEHVRLLKQTMPGVVMTRMPPRTLWQSILGVGGPANDLCNSTDVPVMFVKGPGPFARVVHPVLDDAVDERTALVATDLARMLAVPITLIRVRLPDYFGGSAADADRLIASLERRLKLYGVPFETLTLTGNPVRQIAGATKPTDLIVVARGRSKRDGFSSPDVALRIARKASATVLVRTLVPA